MQKPDLRRYIEDELRERVETAERVYRTAANGNGFSKLGASQNGAVETFQTFKEALQNFNQFVLHNQLPSAQSVLEGHLRRVIAATGADSGDIQVREQDGEALKIAVQWGCKRPFLDFFATVHDGRGASCGAAAKTGERVIVNDVTESTIFAGTEALEVLRDAGVRACQSTPLVSPTGDLVGMLSTHYGEPKRPSEHDFEVIDQLATTAAAFLAAP